MTERTGPPGPTVQEIKCNRRIQAAPGRTPIRANSSPDFAIAANFFRQGRIRDAEMQLRGILAVEPDHHEGHMLLGVVLARTGRLGESESHLERVLSENPNRADALFWLANVKRNTQRFEQAIELCRRALAVSPANPILLNEMGMSCLAVDLATAVDSFSKAVSLDPASPTYQFHLGLAYRGLSQLYPAREALEGALRLDPSLLNAAAELAAVLELLGAHEEVIQVLERALKQHPHHDQFTYRLAVAYAAVGRHDEAEATFRKMVASHPASANLFGFWLQQSGRFDESVSCFITALDARPIQGTAFYGLTEARTFEIEGKSLAEVAEAVLPEVEPMPEERAYLYYALAAAYEKRESFREAMSFYDRANETAFQMYNAARSYDQELRKKLNDGVIAQYNDLEHCRNREGCCDSRQPIFIVGMIRSGTTLLDQILVRHSSVESAGEPVFWLQESDALRRKGITQPTIDQMRDIAARYMASLEATAPSSERIIDKMPLNYARLGLIHSIFPRAKIVHLRRSPLDTCLSIYTTYFGQGPNFAYNQENIVFNYLEYMRLMNHWRSALPVDSLLEVDYEELVTNPMVVTQRVLTFCELPWEDACIHREANRSDIKTPSVWQARQPVYRTSVERWRRFEPWLGGLASLKDIRHPTC